MPETFSTSISNSLNELERLLGGVSAFLEKNHLDGQSYAAQLALEEFITNTIKYGYNDGADHRIEVRVEITTPAIRITIIDDGHEFDPLAEPNPDVSAPVEQREIGGLGIFLVRKLASALKYRRLDGLNIVEVEIAIPSEV